MSTVADRLVSLHERWAKIIDKARYLGEEYRQKERENGIPWRAAYIIELRGKVKELIAKYGNPLQGCKHWNGDPTDVIYFLIEKDYREVMLHAARL